MSLERLSRSSGRAGADRAAPVRLLHLGLGNFFRAHQACYTYDAPDTEQWGYAAFSGRSTALAVQLAQQDGLYTLVERASGGDRFSVIGSVSRAHAGSDHETLLGYFRSAELAAVTLTITEAGYLRGPDGGLDTRAAGLDRDIEVLRRDPSAPVETAPARLVAGLLARRSADGGPLAIVPCDNLTGNGAMVERIVRELAGRVDPALVTWVAESVSTVTTVVDRITPRTVASDVATVRGASDYDDQCPVITEPFKEWILAGTFPAGRPRWEGAGATFTGDVTPFEQRKLWLLNGAHSLLAYAGSISGCTTVAEAVEDELCRARMLSWWREVSRHLSQPEADLEAYRAALLSRFANPRIRHQLAQIAADGSQKLPIRVLPVLRAERRAGRIAEGGTFILGAWVCHLRGMGATIIDPRAEEMVALAAGPLVQAVGRVVRELDPDLGDDAGLVSAVAEAAGQISSCA